MFESGPKPELPTGEAKKLGELVSRKWQEHLLLFSQVKNRVLEVNPDIYIPLKLEEGKSSPLGLFAEASLKRNPGVIPERKQTLEFWPEHQRSATLGRIIFGDKQGRIYRDIDLKGIGYVKKESFSSNIAKVLRPGEYTESGRMGLLQEDMALFDRQMTEEFLKAGIRTNRVIAVIELEEIIVNGKKISVSEAIKARICEKDFHPVVEVRAFGTKARVADVLSVIKTGGLTEDQKLLLEDAKKLVSQELGFQETISGEEYLKWFTKTLGQNMGRMHKKGWLHNYIFNHNITLDCRIVDFDSITKIENEDQIGTEVDNARQVIKELSNLIFGNYSKSTMDLFNENYEKVFPLKKRDKYFELLANSPKKL